MSLVLLAGCCTLFVFAATNVMLSLGVALHGRTRSAGWMRRSASSVLFGRCLPATVSTALAFLIVLPSFVAHEPRDGVEAVSLPLAVGAALGSSIVLSALLRGLSALRRTRSKVRGWLRAATRAEIAGWAGPAWIVESDAAGVCVVGLLRSRLLVSRSVLATCTPRELAGIVAHERAHAAARDNWKKLVLRCLPDVLGWLPAARAFERMWETRAEDEADVTALHEDREIGVEIAAALVKLARRRTVTELQVASTFDAGGPIARRVRRLLHGPRLPVGGRRPGWTALGLAVLIPAACCAILPSVSGRVHLVVEAMVQWLRQ